MRLPRNSGQHLYSAHLQRLVSSRIVQLYKWAKQSVCAILLSSTKVKDVTLQQIALLTREKCKRKAYEIQVYTKIVDNSQVNQNKKVTPINGNFNAKFFR